MSWTAESVIIAGFIIEDPDIWEAACDKCNALGEYEWEDMFILTDPITEKDGSAFFGKVIYTVDEYERPKDINSLYCHFSDIEIIQKGFDLFFADLYKEKGIAKPRFGKYLTIMWT